MYSSTLTGFIPHFCIYVHILCFRMVFLSNSSRVFITRLSVFLYCRIQLPQQSYFSCFLLHKTAVEYTRLYFSIAEVLFYTVEPRIPCYDVFLSVGLLNRTLSVHEFC